MAGTSTVEYHANLRAFQEANQRLQRVIMSAKGGGRAALDVAGTVAVNEIKMLLSHPGTIPDRRAVTGFVSAPGAPPALQTRQLRDHMDYKAGEDEHGSFVDIGNYMIYAPYLELGTRKMQHRPFITPGINNVLPRVTHLVANIVDSHERKAAK